MGTAMGTNIAPEVMDCAVSQTPNLKKKIRSTHTTQMEAKMTIF